VFDKRAGDGCQRSARWYAAEPDIVLQRCVDAVHLPLGDQAARRIDHPAAAVGGVAVDQLGRLTLAAQPESLVEQQFVGREAVVQLDHPEVLRAEA
jgi:hypothetical protein